MGCGETWRGVILGITPLHLREVRDAMWQQLVAGAIIVAFGGTFVYIDALQMVRARWQDVLAFGLSPWTLLFYALSPIPVFFAWRVVYASAGRRFWLAIVIILVLNQVGTLLGSYAANRAMPAWHQAVGIALGITGVLVAGMPIK
jgi:hypothetical protein